MQADILRTRINAFIGLFFVGTFALGAGLLIWHAATGMNPLADELMPYVTPPAGQ